jgi:protein gp37
MAKTKIEWASDVWNPVTGCTKVSQGCKHCYAETLARRMWATQYPPNADGTPRGFTDIRLHPDRLDQPKRWQRPRRIFVNSMSDLFHEEVPDEFIGEVFAVMLRAPQHTFQILTKRPERMAAWFRDFYANQMPSLNVWLGVSVEDQAAANKRIPLLLQTPAHVRFLSCEPLLGPIDFDLTGAFLHTRVSANVRHGYHQSSQIDWVIVGGESGAGARPMHPDWARSIRDQCQSAGLAFFFKQWGSWWPAPETRIFGADGAYPFDDTQGMAHIGKKAAGRLLDGRTWDEYPVSLSTQV